MDNWIKKTRKNNGFTTADIAISVIVITIFVGLISTLFYNFYMTTSGKNRNAMATNYLIDVIEEIKTMKYDDVQCDEGKGTSINELIQNLESVKSIPKGYKLTGELVKYNEMPENTNKKDRIKILKVTVEYDIGNKTDKIEISTLLTKKRSEL